MVKDGARAPSCHTFTALRTAGSSQTDQDVDLQVAAAIMGLVSDLLKQVIVMF